MYCAAIALGEGMHELVQDLVRSSPVQGLVGPVLEQIGDVVERVLFMDAQVRALWQELAYQRVDVLPAVALRALDHPCHITAAFGALAHQQQVAALDGAAEMGDCGFVTALAAPDVGQQPLADVGRDGLPALTGGFGEAGK